MLKQVSIKNYALIDSIQVNFDKGFNIITGETGAGKSIILEALELLLGSRADVKVLRNKEQKCIVEGEFQIGEYNLKHFFEKNEIDYSENTILRREINPQGKSRAFINDTPVNLNQLRDLAEILVDVHSQHETLDIGKRINQFETLDAYCKEEKLVLNYRDVYQEMRSKESELMELKEQEKKSKLDLDYFQFQFNELEEAKLNATEFTDSEKELELLDNSEEIKSALDRSASILEGDQGAVNALKEVKMLLSKISAFDPRLEKLNERIESALIEIRDITSEIEDVNGKVLFDPKRLQLLQDKINLVNSLLFKHHVKSVEELVELRESLNTKINSITSLDERILKVEKEFLDLEAKAKKQANAISVVRKKSALALEKELVAVFQLLSMPHAELNIELLPAEQLNEYGCDAIRFLFKANKGGTFAELNKVASGGEFSRLMLAMKSVIARVKTLPTIIFDEIDTGVSGEVAHKMGEIMRTMGTTMQVFAITHLPQVAVKGNAHFKVYKQTSKNTTETKITRLDQHQRIEEVAKMLSGDKLSEAALANAKNLLAG